MSRRALPELWFFWFRDVGVDLGYTHYLWGNFPGEDGLSRAIYRLRARGNTLALPLTAPYGPGTLYGLASVEVAGDRFSAGMLYELVGRKPDSNLFIEHGGSEELRTQAYRPAHRLEFEGHYAVTPWLSLMLRPGIYADPGSIDFYVDIGGTVRYSTSRTVARVDQEE